jgi:hypothetical protein
MRPAPTPTKDLFGPGACRVETGSKLLYYYTTILNEARANSHKEHFGPGACRVNVSPNYYISPQYYYYTILAEARANPHKELFGPVAYPQGFKVAPKYFSTVLDYYTTMRLYDYTMLLHYDTTAPETDAQLVESGANPL